MIGLEMISMSPSFLSNSQPRSTTSCVFIFMHCKGFQYLELERTEILNQLNLKKRNICCPKDYKTQSLGRLLQTSSFAVYVEHISNNCVFLTYFYDLFIVQVFKEYENMIHTRMNVSIFFVAAFLFSFPGSLFLSDQINECSFEVSYWPVEYASTYIH